VDIEDVASFGVFHSTTSSDFDQMVAATGLSEPVRGGGLASIVHRDFSAESVNYYRVQGTTSKPLLVSDPVAIDVPATVSPVGGKLTTSTRFVELQVRTGVADLVEISNDIGFETSTTFSVVPGGTTLLFWTLPTIEANSQKLTVHHRAIHSGNVGPAGSIEFTARFAPTVQPISGQRFSSLVTATVVVETDVVFQGAGAGLLTVSLVDPDSVITVLEHPLAPFTIEVPAGSTEPRTWQAVLGGDFGVQVTQNLVLTPAVDIGEASVSVLEGETTTSEDVTLIVEVDGAGEAIFSEAVDFAGAGWQAYADTVAFTLSPGAGQKSIYAAFRNPFTSTVPTARVDITVLEPPAAISVDAGRSGR
jgi:hypothetical protein